MPKTTMRFEPVKVFGYPAWACFNPKRVGTLEKSTEWVFYHDEMSRDSLSVSDLLEIVNKLNELNETDSVQK